MKNRIDILEERLNYVQDIIGEVDFIEISNKYKQLSIKDKFKTICDVIYHLQKDISENDSIYFKEVFKKFEVLKPFFDMEKLKNSHNLQEKEMYVLITDKSDEIKSFLDNINYVKENLNFLELNPITDGNKKIEAIKPLEIDSIELDSKLLKMNNNVDILLKNYNETCDVINKKFALYDKLLSKLENKH